jgi:alpha-beta hydrolase superfamily lysophospholipase
MRELKQSQAYTNRSGRKFNLSEKAGYLRRGWCRARTAAPDFGGGFWRCTFPRFCEISAVRRFLSSKFRGIAACLALIFVAGCAPQYTTVNYSKGDSVKGESFGYRKWISQSVEQDVIIIGIHGFCGASIDYANLGNHFLQYQPKTGVYAYEVRGQGSDPIHARRGDIGDPADWYRDLFAFTQLVREQHPDAKVVWFGESMGALIASHAWRLAPANDPPCDGLVLSSPIVRFRDDIPAWTPGLIQIAATTLPLARVSLAALAGGGEVQMTQTTTHSAQSRKNPYDIDKHTLRLLAALGRHIDGMNHCAATFRTPVLVLHGGKDYFNNDSDVRGFVARIPAGVSKTYHNYPQAYHLLMYDEKREVIFKDIARWTNKLRKGRL